jgi:endonuclease G
MGGWVYFQTLCDSNQLFKTAEHLTLADVKYPEGPDGGDRHKSVFKEDESIPLPFRALLKDYFRSGYDRGHM